MAWLYRPLAEDEQRVLYWLRHTTIGVLLSVAGGLATLIYALLTPGGPDRMKIIVLAVPVIIGSPVVLLLPLRGMLRDYRGVLFFYAWTVADVAVIVTGAHWDRGAASPLAALLFLSLAFVTVAYPPGGVALMGAISVGSYLLVGCAAAVTPFAWFMAAVMAAFTGSCALTSRNQWAAFDQQVLLIQTQQILAETDPLTGLLNRRALLARLADATAVARSGNAVLLCVIDLDGFKHVNDSSGHAAGDEVLRAVARALSHTVRETDTIARLGGDEFALLAQLPPRVDGTDGGAVLAERVRAAVARVGSSAGVTASIGTTLVLGEDDPEHLLVRADGAMYGAKALGGNLVHTAT